MRVAGLNSYGGYLRALIPNAYLGGFLFVIKLNSASSYHRIQSKILDNRTGVRYNFLVATLGLSYGTVQRNE